MKNCNSLHHVAVWCCIFFIYQISHSGLFAICARPVVKSHGVGCNSTDCVSLEASALP